MSIEQTPDPASICPGVPIIQTTSGPRPAGVPDEDAYFAATLEAGDGVQTLGPIGQKHYYDNLLRSESWPEGGGGITTMHPRDAAMLGLAHLIEGMSWQSKDMRMISGGIGVAPSSPALTVHKLGKCSFDWPEWDSTDIPVNRALITTPDEARWNVDEAVRSSFLMEGSENVYGPGTMLRYLGEYEIPLRLIAWFGHKDIRRGFEARLAAMLAAERTHEIWHRRVRVPEYFGADVRLVNQSSSRPDGQDTAQANRWPLEVSIVADVAQLELVRIPGYTIGVALETEIDGLA